MHRVSTVDLIRNFGVYGDEAMSNPVIVTKNGRDRLVLVNIEQYEKMRRACNALVTDEEKQTPSRVAQR